MTDFLLPYGLFLAKTLTLLVSIILTFLAILMIVARFKGRPSEGSFVIENVNAHLDEIRDLFNSEILSKSEYKRHIKEQKNSSSCLESASQTPPRLFVLNFEGDIKASQVANLRESVTALIAIVQPRDEVLVILESGGGFVPHYGLAASQLARFRDRNISLTVAIDKIAASGGYLMACVANKIICARFAVIGSIGVMAIVPNIHRLLEKHDIEVEQHTAGRYKRTLTLLGKNTEEAREKFKEELTETHTHFKEFISKYRPYVDLEETATGEHWSGEKAKTLGLVDELQTSDDYILSKYPDYKIFKVKFKLKKSFKERLATNFAKATSEFLEKLVFRFM